MRRATAAPSPGGGVRYYQICGVLGDLRATPHVQCTPRPARAISMIREGALMGREGGRGLGWR